MPNATAGRPTESELGAVRLMLSRLGISPTDLLDPMIRSDVPTFADYTPVVATAVSDACRRAYTSYRNRIVERWGDRRLAEPTPSDIKQLAEQVRVNVVRRRNSRGGRSAMDHLITALRCLYRRAIAEAGIAEINRVAATTGNDPELDWLLLRLHIETACAAAAHWHSAPVTSTPTSA
jgi:integrase/recombinase XerC